VHSRTAVQVNLGKLSRGVVLSSLAHGSCASLFRNSAPFPGATYPALIDKRRLLSIATGPALCSSVGLSLSDQYLPPSSSASRILHQRYSVARPISHCHTVIPLVVRAVAYSARHSGPIPGLDHANREPPLSHPTIYPRRRPPAIVCEIQQHSSPVGTLPLMVGNGWTLLNHLSLELT
jgi:hypothetical protein